MKIAVIGAGITGLTIGYLMSKMTGSSVDFFEKKGVIGGNILDAVDPMTEIIVPIYGAHIFHTYNELAWKFVNLFSEFNNYQHRVKVWWKNTHYDWPITYDNIVKITGVSSVESAKEELKKRGERWKSCAELNFETKMLSQIGEEMYEIFIKRYTEKMWERPASTLNARLAARTPVRLTNEKNLFLDPYQGFPSNGYLQLIENMVLNINDCSIFLNEEMNEERMKKHCHKYEAIFVTSPIDEWFSYRIGRLEYRGMRFQYIQQKNEGFVLPSGTVNVNSSPDLLRIEEPKQYYQQNDKAFTVLVKNFASGSEQYYPVPDLANDLLAEKYRNMALSDSSVVFCGRLANYRYINMDQAILNAMKEVEKITGLSAVKWMVEK